MRFYKNNKVIAKCNEATADLLIELAKEHLTIEEVYSNIHYDIDAKKVCSAIIENGFGNHVAKALFKKEDCNILPSELGDIRKRRDENENMREQFKIAKLKTKSKKRMYNTVNRIRKMTGVGVEKSPAYNVQYAFYSVIAKGYKNSKQCFARTYFRTFSNTLLKQLSKYEDLTEEFKTQYGDTPISLVYSSYLECGDFKNVVDKFFNFVESEAHKNNTVGNFIEVITPMALSTDVGDRSLTGKYKEEKNLKTVLALVYKTEDRESMLIFDILYTAESENTYGKKGIFICPTISVTYLEGSEEDDEIEPVVLKIK